MARFSIGQSLRLHDHTQPLLEPESFRAIELRVEYHAGGGRPVIPPLQARSGRMRPAYVVFERARARTCRDSSGRAGQPNGFGRSGDKEQMHRCR